MTKKQIELIIGSLLHDIGKVVYRSGDGRNHSQSGYDYLKNEAKIDDQQILDCVRYHHAGHLKTAKIGDDHIAYITYFADNIASAVDRRESVQQEDGFDKKMPLTSIFNILNGNNGNCHYARQVLNQENGINYPTDQPVKMEDSFYQKIVRDITDNLKGISLKEEYINSLLSILEANLSYIPSSTSKREQADISLYDHLKITAAFAQCVEQYLEAKGQRDYKEVLYKNAQDSYKEKMFLLYSMDISGIQNFIYTIASKGALRDLRARSFYLEIIMEHMIDELLSRLSLSRASLVYSGGGHCYILLPNTDYVKDTVEKQEELVNTWFLNTFGTALYVAGGYAPCSANDLRNMPDGSYAELYQQMSRQISGKKAHRYGAAQIRMLNTRAYEGERECVVCRRSGKVNKDERCPICAALQSMSGSILYNNFFTVISEYEEGALPLPGNRFLVAGDKKELLHRMEQETYVRCYTKNDIYSGKHVTTKLWVGDYTTGDTFEELASKAEGISRIGVLRADVDNLGRTFVSGFQRPDEDTRFVTLSRTATLSRQLSLFFKCYINQILENGECDCLGTKGKRNIAIVYSGGDDVFLVGAWNEVVEAFIDLKKALERFTQNTLTLSGGIGLYQSGYPVNIMAKEVEKLEDQAKHIDGKNAVTLFEENGAYPWDVFLNRVLDEKFKVIYEFFEQSEERGKAFLYHLLELIRKIDEPINKARYVYLLSRMEPERGCSKEQMEAYRTFSRKMYGWTDSVQNRKELTTAIYLYVYLKREKEEA